MKCLVVLAAILALSSAQLKPFNAPSAFRQPRREAARVVPRAAASDQAANVLRLVNDINPDGSFVYELELDNGISAKAQGTPRNVDGETPVVIEGSYSFTSPDGVPVAITYVADENGYQAQGDAIPTPPPVPPQIAKALKYIAKYASQTQSKKASRF